MSVGSTLETVRAVSVTANSGLNSNPVRKGSDTISDQLRNLSSYVSNIPKGTLTDAAVAKAMQAQLSYVA